MVCLPVNLRESRAVINEEEKAAVLVTVSGECKTIVGAGGLHLDVWPESELD